MKNLRVSAKANGHEVDARSLLNHMSWLIAIEAADFGMKAHIGLDVGSGLVLTACVTTGSVHDARVMDNLIRE